MQKLRERTSALEVRVSFIEDEVAPLQRDLSYDTARLDDLRNRLRRNNIRTIDIPEQAEVKNPVTFI